MALVRLLFMLKAINSFGVEDVPKGTEKLIGH